MKIYTDIVIQANQSGFGQFQRGELHVSPENSWKNLEDLLSEIPEEPIEIDEAIERFGIDDPRGSILGGDPDHLYWLNISCQYLGIEESEVAEDFFRVEKIMNKGGMTGEGII